jgi:CheY-like chemotaxis protein
VADHLSFAFALLSEPTMAIDLLNGERSRSEGLNSCTGAAGENHGSEPAIRETITGAAFAEASEWSGPETILLVEDEAFVRNATAEILESAGYRLVIAASAREALAAYRRCSWPVDLLLADIVMPGMSGRELAVELEDFYPHPPVLLMSGYAEQLAWCALFPNGAECLVKPFSAHTLLSGVRKVLDHEKESAMRSHYEGTLQEESGAMKLSEQSANKIRQRQGHAPPGTYKASARSSG